MKNLRIIAAFLRRDWTIMRSYRYMVGFDFVTTFFNLFMFFSLGRLLDRGISKGDPTLAHGYFSFAVVGMVIMSIGLSAMNSFASQMQTEQTTGSLEALLATPANPSLLILSTSTYVFLRSALTSTLQVTVAAIFFDLRFTTGWIAGIVAVAALIANIALFTSIGIVVAGLTVVFKRTSQIVVLASTGLGLISGVYYPISVLPRPVQFVAKILPLTWGIEVLRQALLANSVAVGRFILLIIVALAALPIALRIFGISLQQARRAGSLGKY